MSVDTIAMSGSLVDTVHFSILRCVKQVAHRVLVAQLAMPFTEEAVDALDPVRLLRAPEVAAHRLGRPALSEKDRAEENVERQDDAVALLR